MSCAIHLLLDDRLSDLIQKRSDMTHFDIAYASKKNMVKALRAFDYDAVFLTAANIELLESIKETNAHRVKTILRKIFINSCFTNKYRYNKLRKKRHGNPTMTSSDQVKARTRNNYRILNIQANILLRNTIFELFLTKIGQIKL